MSTACTGTGRQYIFRAETVRMHTEADLKGDQEMRFCVNSQKDGEEARKKIRKMMKDEEYITIGQILELWHSRPVDEAYYEGWKCSVAKRKLRLRKIKGGWALYLPDETIDMPWKPKAPEPITWSINPDVIPDKLNLRTCRVISKPKKNVIAEDFGYFHCWFQSAMPNSHGDIIMQALGIVEMQDGTVRQVRPDHIIFGWEE